MCVWGGGVVLVIGFPHEVCVRLGGGGGGAEPPLPSVHAPPSRPPLLEWHTLFDLGTPLPLSVSNAGPEGLRSPKSVHPRATGILHRIRSVANPPPPLLALLPPPPPCISYALVQATVGVGTVIILYAI